MTKQGKLTFWKLVEEVDLAVDRYRPGVLESMRFGKTIVQEMARNPRGGLCI